MRRGIATTTWHAVSFILTGCLFFFFVLPRWPELSGDISQTGGTTLRIVTGAVLALTALPVVFTLVKTRRPEFGTPHLALNLRLSSIIAHALAALMIITTAIIEIWVDLDRGGQWLFAGYGAAAAIAVLGAIAFYLAYVAESSPPPPRPLKPKKVKVVEAPDVADEAADDESEPDEVAPETVAADDTEADVEEPRGGLRNKRPSRDGVALAGLTPSNQNTDTPTG